MIAGELALASAALFAGAAVYVSFAEHPARQNLAPAAALTEWKPAYKRGAAMQASLALIGFVLGLIARWQTGAGVWLPGAIVLVANWPWTLFVILPVKQGAACDRSGQCRPRDDGATRHMGAVARNAHLTSSRYHLDFSLGRAALSCATQAIRSPGRRERGRHSGS
jgi:hypothetical protein